MDVSLYYSRIFLASNAQFSFALLNSKEEKNSLFHLYEGKHHFMNAVFFKGTEHNNPERAHTMQKDDIKNCHSVVIFFSKYF